MKVEEKYKYHDYPSMSARLVWCDNKWVFWSEFKDKMYGLGYEEAGSNETYVFFKRFGAQQVLINSITKEVIDLGVTTLPQAFKVCHEMDYIDKPYYICEVCSPGYYKRLNK